VRDAVPSSRRSCRVPVACSEERATVARRQLWTQRAQRVGTCGAYAKTFAVMTSDSRFRWLGIAACVHAFGLLVVSRVAREGQRSPESPPARSETVVEVEVMLSGHALWTPTAFPDEMRPAKAVTREARPRALSNPRTVGMSMDGEFKEVPLAKPQGGTDTTGAWPSLAETGVSKPNPFLTTLADPLLSAEGSQPPGSTAANVRLQKSLQQELHSRDVALGLGSSGPAVHALEDAVRADATGPTGHALFEVAIDSIGTVTSVVAQEGGELPFAWARTAELTYDSLRSKRFRVPSRSAGVRITIAIDVCFSSGSPKLNVSIANGRIQAAQCIGSSRLEILPVKERQVSAVGVPLVHWAGDPGIAAKAQRVVHARVIKEELQ